MLSLHEFRSLPREEQYYYLWERGDCLAERMPNQTLQVLLFHAGSFFVEMLYNYEKNELLEIIPLRSCTLLEPYLAEINISSLFKS